ncbi:hypothetical protein CFB84_30100 [Burkholderia aenigmatica]|uniref:Uncharacterized protein n=1 Tax=Burkholderia aenigmatica TaxID=2015348 RepID=A0A228I571_9BURK|nr:hypothetical protein CFB84_30100 [Burkholderia aenigmatica]
MGVQAQKAHARIESSVCQTSRVRAGQVYRRFRFKWGPASHFQRTESCMRAGTPIACRIAPNCN